MIQVNLTREQILRMTAYIMLGSDIAGLEDKIERALAMRPEPMYCGHAWKALQYWLFTLMRQGESMEAMERQFEMVLLNDKGE